MPRPDTEHHIAIVGMSCRFPDADDAEALWENLCAARSSFRPIPAERWNHSLFHSQRGTVVLIEGI